MKKELILLVVGLLSIASSPEKTYPVAQIKTDFGDVLVWLYDQTPRHKASFIKLATTGYWDTHTFNRVIKNFVAQGGCPDTPEGFSNSPYLLEPEFVPTLRHVYGTLGAGRDDNPQKLSAGCQFYIVQNKNGLPILDNNYTVYGQVFKGMDIIDAIVAVPTDSLDAPLTPIRLDVNIINLKKSEIERMGWLAEG